MEKHKWPEDSRIPSVCRELRHDCAGMLMDPLIHCAGLVGEVSALCIDEETGP